MAELTFIAKDPPETEDDGPPSPKEPGKILFYALDITPPEKTKKEYEIFVVEWSGGGAFWIQEGVGFSYFITECVGVPTEGLWLIHNLTVSYTRGDGYTTDDDEDHDYSGPVSIGLADLKEPETNDPGAS